MRNVVGSLRSSWAGPYELILFGLAYLTYFGVRAVTQGQEIPAVQRAWDLLDTERSLGLAWEHTVQRAVTDSDWLIDGLNAVYIYGHWPVLIVGGIVLFHLSRSQYLRLRNVVLVSGAAGLVIFALFPVAPPRLAGVGLLDTVTLRAEGYRDVFPPSIVNEYAAVPSFHAGWNLMLGIALFQSTRRLWLRIFAVCMPVTMILAVVATGNHFILDVLAGAAIVLASLYAVDRHRRAGEARARLDADGGAAMDGREQLGPAALRGRPSRRQRPDCTEPGASLAGQARRS